MKSHFVDTGFRLNQYCDRIKILRSLKMSDSCDSEKILSIVDWCDGNALHQR